MATTYEALVAAGAPAIVEPEFYRIKRDGYSDNALLVEVRKRRSYNGSDLLIRKTVYVETDEAVISEVVAACKQAVGEVRLKEMVETIVGDHPA
ncbi:hypothetical protein AB4Y81_03290 [Paenarthrobacter sp. TAF1]|uniref:hypothetical protein n=1 Tax=Paenarthrobacter sp. TAF1 TaxID=3233067 RepID=UPI003F95DE76